MDQRRSPGEAGVGRSPDMTGSRVEIDRRRNSGMLIYFAVLGVGGAVVLGFTLARSWGFWGWSGGILLLFTSIASVVSMKWTGGAGLARCPVCGHANEVLHVTEHRYLCCGGCKTWLEGSTSMAVVPDDHHADHPAFDLVLPESVVWPEGCPVCGRPVTRTIALEGTDVIGDVAAMVAPVSIQKVAKLDAPACSEHDDGVALRREGGSTIICFRSLGYWRRFMQVNALDPR